MTQISTRRQHLNNSIITLSEAQDRMNTAGQAQGRAALKNLNKAGRALQKTADELVHAGNYTLGAGANLVVGGGYAVSGTAHIVAGTALGAAGGVALAGEASANVFGRALQHLGRGLIKAGNRARSHANIGGAQYMVKDVLGDKFAKTWAASLVTHSRDQFRQAGNDYMTSLCCIAASVACGGMTVAELALAAKSTAEAAAFTLNAARHAGSSGIIEIAERAVEIADCAMLLVEQALAGGERCMDAAGAALQAAGKALIVAGNAVNTARGTDTAVFRRSQSGRIAEA